jgi:diacylglycerol kinase family enzyme
MLILLNKYANAKGCLRKWQEVKRELEDKHIRDEYALAYSFDEFQQRFYQCFKDGECHFVAAGGDGTVHFLVNQIMKMSSFAREQIVVGAIGLGSSNDFHKTYSVHKGVNHKLQLKLDYRSAIHHNIGQVDFEDENLKWQRRFFIINCSVGIIAQANYLFNSNRKVVGWLKPRWVMGAIWYSALETLFLAKNIPAEIFVDKKKCETEVTSLSIFINPHVSGNFCYDFAVSPQGDSLGVALCERMGILERLKTLFSLAQGKFSGLPKTRTWMASRLEFNPKEPVALEMDGEVCLARRIKIKLLRKALKVCQ